jgi:hypothetical protein
MRSTSQHPKLTPSQIRALYQSRPVTSWPIGIVQTRALLASVGVDLETAPVRCDLRRHFGVVLLRDRYGSTVVGPMRHVDAVLRSVGIETVDCFATA